MRTQLAMIVFTGLAAILLAVSGRAAFAAEPVPGDACAVANRTMWSSGATAGQEYLMSCQGGVWVRLLETSPSGQVSIRKATPVVPLDIANEIRFSSSGLACINTTTATSTEGAERYNPVKKSMDFCNGTKWISFPAICANNSPALSFTNQTGVATSTSISSNIVKVTGLSCPSTVTVSPGTYQICSDAACANTLQVDQISNNQYLQIFVTSAAQNQITTTATITVGGTTTTWTVTTSGNACGSSPTPGTVCPDGTIYAGLTPDGSVPMYVQRCDAGMTWSNTANACVGLRFLIDWVTPSTATVLANITNDKSGKTNTANWAALSNADSPYIAVQYCKQLSEGGKTDWYVPARQELQLIDSNYAAIGNLLANGIYNGSNEFTTTTMWGWKMNGGGQQTPNKAGGFYLRCARR